MAALDALATLLEGHIGRVGPASVRDLIARAVNTGVKLDTLRMDLACPRLDYYTGAIFEVTVDEAPVGSICGGGRYDDLTGIFGWKGMSGVGISFGADRIEDVLNHLTRGPPWPAMGWTPWWSKWSKASCSRSCVRPKP